MSEEKTMRCLPIATVERLNALASTAEAARIALAGVGDDGSLRFESVTAQDTYDSIWRLRRERDAAGAQLVALIECAQLFYDAAISTLASSDGTFEERGEELLQALRSVSSSSNVCSASDKSGSRRAS